MAAETIRVGVAGAHGRLGRIACTAISGATGLTLVAGFVHTAPATAADGELPLFDDLTAFYAVGMDVVIDCTVVPITRDVARRAVDAGVSPVIGATGWSQDDADALAARCREAAVGALLVPNFSIGAALMMRFAAEAATFLPNCEIIELHHDGKRDKPSGTSLMTARRIREAGGPASIPIHSVRLPGLVAHQETIFGGTGETLTIRHDSMGHAAYAAGIVLAARNVRAVRGLVSGLDALLFARKTA